MKKIFVNLKDWLNLDENEDFSKQTLGLPIVIFPSLPYLYIYKERQNKIGVQNLCVYDSGAHTCSISIEHLKEFGVSWAILNHREYRTLTKEALISKISTALDKKINPIICFENEDELEMIVDISKDLENFGDLYLAYEPAEDIAPECVKEIISKITKKTKNVIEGEVHLLYGGNVSLDNIDYYNRETNVDGFLISRHALQVEELKRMVYLLK